VAVRRLPRRVTGGGVGGPPRLAAASPDREDEQQGEVSQAEAAHAPQRDGAGVAGVAGAGVAGAAGAPGAAGAGALAGGGAASRTAGLARSPPRMARVDDGDVETNAVAGVGLAR